MIQHVETVQQCRVEALHRQGGKAFDTTFELIIVKTFRSCGEVPTSYYRFTWTTVVCKCVTLCV